MTEIIEGTAARRKGPVNDTWIQGATWSALVNLIFAGYAILGLIYAYISRDLLFTDGISYLLIANQYEDGNWARAVNGYWGPLLSWLLVPFLGAGIDPQAAFRVLNWVIGGVALAAAWRLSRHFSLPVAIRVLFLAIAAIMLVAWSVTVITPDLLSVCLLLFLFDRLLNDDLLDRSASGLICGVLGGLAYLAKPFAFGYFVIAFPLAVLWHAFVQRRTTSLRRIATTLLLGFGTFLCFAAPWIAIISVKYDELTIATSGSFNMAIRSPQLHTHPHLLVGLLAPPFNDALSIWYDPSLEPYRHWNPLGSTSDLMFEAKKVVRNLRGTVGFFGWISFVLAGLVGVAVVRRDRMDFIRSAVGLSVVLIGVYIGLYCLVLVEGRYVWPVMVLSWLVAMSLIVRLGRTFRRGSMLVSTLLVVVSILVLIDPVGLRSSTIQTRGATSLVNMSSELDLADELMDLEVIPDAPGPVASNGQWDNSMYFSYYHDTEYYGLLRSGATDAENRRALADSRIEWFLLWGKDTSVPAYLMDYTLAAVALDGDLRVFRRR